MNTLIGLAWVSSVLGVITGSNVTQEYLGDPNMFWTIRLLDLGIVIPAGLATGIGLLLHRRFATTAVYGVLGFGLCEIGAVAGMAAVMEWKGDPAASVPFLVFALAATAAMAALASCWLRRYLRAASLTSRARLSPRTA